jgi:hypothetical protein
MNDGHLVIAYHGCDITTRDDLVTGKAQPKSSENQYDWLGPGFYFFEADADRAEAFARSAHGHPEKRYTAQPIATPAVVGSVLCIRECLDMTTRRGLTIFEEAVKPTLDGLKAEAKALPKNLPAADDDGDVLLRHLDNAVFRFLHQYLDSPNKIHYQAVRGAFRQGTPLAENSGFHRDSHIQLAVRDPTCFLGWFLRPGEKLLSASKAKKARQTLADFKASHPKPRVQAAAK